MTAACLSPLMAQALLAMAAGLTALLTGVLVALALALRAEAHRTPKNPFLPRSPNHD